MSKLAEWAREAFFPEIEGETAEERRRRLDLVSTPGVFLDPWTRIETLQTWLAQDGVRIRELERRVEELIEEGNRLKAENLRLKQGQR